MSSLRPQDRKSLCRFTFDGRQCRTQRAGRHPHFRPFHAPSSASSASLHNFAIIVFLFFSPFAFSPFRQESTLNNTLPNPFKCNIYKPSRKC
jgi:hypothetical protein